MQINTVLELRLFGQLVQPDFLVFVEIAPDGGVLLPHPLAPLLTAHHMADEESGPTEKPGHCVKIVPAQRVFPCFLAARQNNFFGFLSDLCHMGGDAFKNYFDIRLSQPGWANFLNHMSKNAAGDGQIKKRRQHLFINAKRPQRLSMQPVERQRQ